MKYVQILGMSKDNLNVGLINENLARVHNGVTPETYWLHPVKLGYSFSKSDLTSVYRFL